MPEPSPGRGLPAQTMRVFGSISRHLQSLAELAGVEGREAVALYVRIAIFLGVGLIALLFGYIFLLLFVAFAIATLAGVSWMWITLGIAAVHLIGALACGLYVKGNYRKPVFKATGEEIRKDITALRGQPSTQS